MLILKLKKNIFNIFLIKNIFTKISSCKKKNKNNQLKKGQN